MSVNYIAYAATLMQSVAVHLPGVERFIVLSDVMQDFDDIQLSATVLDCDHLGIKHITNMKAWYTIIEFNTAIKPFAFLYMFEELGFADVCYLDPDVLLLSDMAEVFSALTESSCVLTPHMMRPLQDGKEPSDLTIMKSGIYNLGFIGLRNDKEGRFLVRWWADRCFRHCRVDIAGNMFTDQRWMDLAPALTRHVHILRHPGYNTAYWNLPHRNVKRAPNGTWLVNGRRLVFFHFSGIVPDDPNKFSKHQNRYTSANLGIVNDLCNVYRDRVLANKWSKYSRIGYGFGKFSDNRRIDDAMRHWITRSIDDGRIDPKKELNLSSSYFDHPDEGAAEEGVVITRYMHQFRLDRHDLQSAFDIFTGDGLGRYYDWFLSGDAERQGVDVASITAARALRGGLLSPDVQSLHKRTPPWPSVSTRVWTETSTLALEELTRDIMLDGQGAMLRVPRHLALLWERRNDLQAAFDLSVPGRLQDYLSWALTSGLRERAVDIVAFSPQFVQWFSTRSRISAFYGDVPVTEGMILLRRASEAKQYLPDCHRFPVERSGRLAFGLWFAFIAPTLFGWPGNFVAPVRQFFFEPTETGTDCFRLSRAAIAIWELRGDLQRAFPLTDSRSTWKYLRWILVDGLRELCLTIDEFDPRLRPYLLSGSPRFPGITQLQEMVHDSRHDLNTLFDLALVDDRLKMVAWAERHIVDETFGLPLGEALRPVKEELAPRCIRSFHRATLALSGHWTAPSGRGEDVRGSAWALNAVGYKDYVLVDLENRVVMTPDGEALPPGAEIKVDINIVHTNADTAAEDAAVLKGLDVISEKAIGFWAWELEWLPDYWRYAYSFYDEIWASTQFAESAFNVDSMRPVIRVPMVVAEPEIGMAMSRAALGLPEEATGFLFTFDFRSHIARKNPEAVIRAFLSAFPDDEKAYLLIKTSGAASMPAEAAHLRTLAMDTRIELRDTRMDRAHLLNLIRSADAFVSLHRSEGFGRGPAEAMLFGVPAIVTDYSGTADYATRDCALLVDYAMTPVNEADYPGVTGQQWAEANSATAAEHMRWVHEHHAKARALGQRGRKQIRKLYNARRVGETMLAVLGLGHDQSGAGSRPQSADYNLPN